MINGFGFDYKLNLIYVKYELTIMINEPNLSFNKKNNFYAYCNFMRFHFYLLLIIFKCQRK